ncbi:MAG: hypothetical protein EON87_07875 [Brevundimonas sp.]|nr:MAG: hypothetical protein EON87_07875 [Brevundimonas sp.]
MREWQPRLFEGDATGRRAPFGIKGYLFSLNLQMDWILGRVESIRWAYDPITIAPRQTEMELAVLLLEDRRFFKHGGFEKRSILRVFRQIVTFKRVGGVSTIEQQLVRTLIDRRERTLRRKSREIILASILSMRLAKRDILRIYLSTAYLGYRVRGCDEAGRLIFGIDAPELDFDQAAVIASLLVYPLPKAVRVSVQAQAALSPAEFFELAEGIDRKWTRRVRRRFNYCLSIRGKAEQPAY